MLFNSIFFYFQLVTQDQTIFFFTISANVKRNGSHEMTSRPPPKQASWRVCLIKYLQKHQDIVYAVNDQLSCTEMYKYLLCKSQKNIFPRSWVGPQKEIYSKQWGEIMYIQIHYQSKVWTHPLMFSLHIHWEKVLPSRMRIRKCH